MHKYTKSGLVAAGALALACGGSSDKQNVVAAGGTGAFGIVTVNGKQKMYLPIIDLNAASHAHIEVVDVGVGGNGVSGAPAQLADIDLGDTDYATTTGGDSTVIIAASTDNATVRLIDPTHDTVKKTIHLDATFGTSGFSGGGGYVTGIAMDSANHRAILSVWNGFALLDTSSGTIIKVIEAPPSENFGFDSVHQRILAPFYDCTSSTSSGVSPTFCASYPDHGLNVIDLSDGTVYTYVNATPPSPLTAADPIGDEPDSAAADPNTQEVMVASEGGGFQDVIDLAHATFDKNAHTVTAAEQVVQNTPTTGVAIEQSQHLAFLEAEGSSLVGLVDVTAAAGGTGLYLGGEMPNTPSGDFWSNIGDPHGVAVTTGISDGKPVGFVVESARRWVARVDLDKLKSLADSSGIVADMSSAVTFLDSQAHE